MDTVPAWASFPSKGARSNRLPHRKINQCNAQCLGMFGLVLSCLVSATHGHREPSAKEQVFGRSTKEWPHAEKADIIAASHFSNFMQSGQLEAYSLLKELVMLLVSHPHPVASWKVTQQHHKLVLHNPRGKFAARPPALVRVPSAKVSMQLRVAFKKISKQLTLGMSGFLPKLPGRSQKMRVNEKHFVLGTPMEGPWPVNMRVLVFANGCFWGSEKGIWRLPGDGVYSTAVGYSAGSTPNPTYPEVKSGRTGSTEAVQVVYDPEKISLVDLLRWFWEAHDPTQGMGQGNDIGTQYRSGLYYFDDEQRQLFEASKAAYEKALAQKGKGRGKVKTEIIAASDFDQVFYYAEDYHQQYLAKPGARPYCSAQPQQVSLPPYQEWVPKTWSSDLIAKHAPKLPETFWQQHGPKPLCVIRSPNEPIEFP